VNPAAISFRPLQRDDFPFLQRWLNEPHVLQWWNQPLSLAEVEAKYAPRVDGLEPTYDFIIEYEQQPIGWIQWYRWSDYWEHALHLGADKDSAGVDFAIGKPSMIGRGIGSAALRKFVSEIVFVDSGISGVYSDPDEKNVRSLRTFANAGFRVVRTINVPGENCVRSVVHLNRSEYQKV
jgi:RimJ/RimL family protein N-acetyltransferase